MEKLSNYIQGLSFEYAISYSGLRGEKFIHLEKETEEEIKKIEKEIESARFMQIPKLNKKIEALKAETNIYNSRIINEHGELHKSAMMIHRFEKDSQELQSIVKILSSNFEEQLFVMCPPVFRDSIVFYSKEDKIMGILQMCFSCWWMKNEKEEDLEVDHNIFPLLKEKLIQLGHQIEHE